jgi:hypothetical protein
VKFEPPLTVSLSLYVFVQFLALMAANSQFLALLPKQGTGLNVLFFVFILVSLVCLGGVLEGRREYGIAEALRLVVTGCAVFSAGTWFGGLRDARWLAGIGIFTLVSLAWLWLGSRSQHRVASGAMVYHPS